MWELVGDFNLSRDWIYIPTSGNFFRFEFFFNGSIECDLAQFEEINGSKFLLEPLTIRSLKAIYRLETPYPMLERGIALRLINRDYGSVRIHKMSINNPGSVTAPNPATTIADSIPDLAANTAEQLLAANPDRKFASIVNNSGSDITIILGETTGAVLGKGILLKGGGGSVVISPNADIWWQGPISAIAGGAISAGQLGVVEGT